MTDMFDEQAATYGWEVLPAQNAQVDAGKQNSQLRAMVDQGANGIQLTAVDANGIVPGLEYADSKGVHVVAIDNLPASGPLYIGVAADNIDMAATACEAIGEAVGGTGVVLGVQGDQSGAAGLDRYTGLKDCFDANYPEIELIDLMAKWDSSQASSMLATALTAYPNPAAIFLASDTAYLAATQQVLQSKGLTAKAGEPGHVYVATVDANPQALDAIRDGSIDAAVSQPIPQMGHFAAVWMNEALAGTEVKAGPTDHDSEVVEYNGYFVDRLPAPLVTSENVDDPDLWANAQ